ncbi:MAG: hypothetical protein ABIJ95_07740 [Pseudomonadota bacterium]
MSEVRYCVVYKGDLQEGRDPEVVKKDLADLFKLSGDKAEKLFSGDPVVVKKDTDEQTANRYKELFELAGAICDVEIWDPDRVEPSSVSAPPGPEQAGDGRIICPKCGFTQEDADSCARCGVVIRKYLSMTMDTSDVGPAEIAAEKRRLRKAWAMVGIGVMLVIFGAANFASAIYGFAGKDPGAAEIQMPQGAGLAETLEVRKLTTEARKGEAAGQIMSLLVGFFSLSGGLWLALSGRKKLKEPAPE